MNREHLSELCARLDRLMRRDPVGRGTERLCAARGGNGAELLLEAAESLAKPDSVVAITTGFYISHAVDPSAETDGPPGTLYLAARLRELGARVALVTDEFAAPILKVGRDRLGLDDVEVHVVPLEVERSPGKAPLAEAWAATFLASTFGANLTHLVSIERAGPSHTADSVRLLECDPAVLAEFEHAVSVNERDVCHNMAGRSIDEHTARVDRLFDLVAARRPDVRTIAVGDGGNELGFGSAPWSKLRGAMTGNQGAWAAARVPADQLLIAGISDWGAYALAIATCHAAGRSDLLSAQQVAAQRALLEALVAETSIVDGISGKREPTVDSLNLDAYLGWFAEALAVGGM